IAGPQEGFGLDGHAYSTFGDHLVDGAVVITQFAQHIARVLTDPGRRSADCSLTDFEAGRGLALPPSPDLRLLKFRHDTARPHLFIVDDFAPPQDRRTRHVGAV